MTAIESLGRAVEKIEQETSSKAQTRDWMRRANAATGTISVGLLIFVLQSVDSVRSEISVLRSTQQTMAMAQERVQASISDISARLNAYQQAADARIGEQQRRADLIESRLRQLEEDLRAHDRRDRAAVAEPFEGTRLGALVAAIASLEPPQTAPGLYTREGRPRVAVVAAKLGRPVQETELAQAWAMYQAVSTGNVSPPESRK